MFITPEEAARRIRSGEVLLLAAQEDVLRGLPAGEWIGGTIPYFMTEEGGTTSRTRVFATPVPGEAIATRIAVYDADRLPRICAEAPENGLTYLILPAASAVHARFAQDAPEYEQMYLKPLVGWIAGVHLDDLGTARPAVVDGRTLAVLTDKAVALHAELPAHRRARIGIVNLFRQGGGDVLVFPAGGFSAERVAVNGVERNLADYLVGAGIDTRLPLVADYNGAMVNVSFQHVDRAARRVDFYAPVFAGVPYQIAAPVADYLAAFSQALPAGPSPVFACNCILNYLYSGLEGKRTAGVTGPITFGEIAYQLLNQTLVYVALDPA